MECSVIGCHRESNGEPSGSKEVNLCSQHYEAWGYFRKGYYLGAGKEDGCLHRPLWNKALQAFLEWCRVEIIACTEIAESVLEII